MSDIEWDVSETKGYGDALNIEVPELEGAEFRHWADDLADLIDSMYPDHVIDMIYEGDFDY